jgi:hypothetical protein
MSEGSQASATPNKQIPKQKQSQCYITMASTVSDFSIIELQVPPVHHRAHLLPSTTTASAPLFLVSFSPCSQHALPQGAIESREGASAPAASLPLGNIPPRQLYLPRMPSYPALLHFRRSFARIQQRGIRASNRQPEALRSVVNPCEVLAVCDMRTCLERCAILLFET